MVIGGLQQTSTLDFPGCVAAVVFTQGCNFRCPHCHNADLVLCRTHPVSEESVLNFLARRKPLLGGVVVSGGEPTLQPDLPAFCAKLKGMKYAVKLDTNGSKPNALRDLLQSRLVDYVAMDLKGAPLHYSRTISPTPPTGEIMDSIALLRESRIAHEFRVTAVAPFVDTASFTDMLRAVDRQAPVFLQKARLDSVLDPDFFNTHKHGLRAGRALTDADLKTLQTLAECSGSHCVVR